MAEVSHISQKGFEDDEGFAFVTCACGVTIGPGPDIETVLDMAMEHAYRAALTIGPQRPTPEEVAGLLRSVEFAMSHGRSAMVAFFDTKYGTSAIERDYERMKEVERQVKAMLDLLPPEPPMTPEHMEKVGAVVSAALRKRSGEGSAEELDAAITAAWPADAQEGSA